MTELKGCPFCGSESVRLCHGDILKSPIPLFKCDGCNAVVSFDAPVCNIGAINGDDTPSVIAWNNRHERTCQMIPDEDYDFVTCSICGYEEERNLLYPPAGLQIFDGNYCPNCGAKVIN